jgi:hypothetical protein
VHSGVSLTLEITEEIDDLKNKSCQMSDILMKKHEGAVGGVYVGTEYAMEKIRGRHDWVN